MSNTSYSGIVFFYVLVEIFVNIVYTFKTESFQVLFHRTFTEIGVVYFQTRFRFLETKSDSNRKGSISLYAWKGVSQWSLASTSNGCEEDFEGVVVVAFKLKCSRSLRCFCVPFLALLLLLLSSPPPPPPPPPSLLIFFCFHMFYYSRRRRGRILPPVLSAPPRVPTIAQHQNFGNNR